jgi:hypothetical protein
MKFSTFLVAVMAKIDTPEKWTQSVNARNSEGKPVPPYSPNATCFCMQGAALAVLPEDRETNIIYYTFNDKLRAKTGNNIPVFNDAVVRKHEEVIAVLQLLYDAIKAEVILPI